MLALGTQFLYTTKRPGEKDRRKEFDFNDLKLPCWRFSAREQAKPAAWAKKRQFSALTAKFGLKITFLQQLDVRGGY